MSNSERLYEKIEKIIIKTTSEEELESMVERIKKSDPDILLSLLETIIKYKTIKILGAANDN